MLCLSWLFSSQSSYSHHLSHHRAGRQQVCELYSSICQRGTGSTHSSSQLSTISLSQVQQGVAETHRHTQAINTAQNW